MRVRYRAISLLPENRHAFTGKCSLTCAPRVFWPPPRVMESSTVSDGLFRQSFNNIHSGKVIAVAQAADLVHSIPPLGCVCTSPASSPFLRPAPHPPSSDSVPPNCRTVRTRLAPVVKFFEKKHTTSPENTLRSQQLQLRNSRERKMLRGFFYYLKFTFKIIAFATDICDFSCKNLHISG